MKILTLSLLIDAYKDRDVVISDVAGTYLLADMEDYVLVKLSGESLDIMCKVNNRHTQYIDLEKERKKGATHEID